MLTNSPQQSRILGRARTRDRPSAPHDQRTASGYIVGEICPRDGKGAGARHAASWALPWMRGRLVLRLILARAAQCTPRLSALHVR
jgi:hypothetical protein